MKKSPDFDSFGTYLRAMERANVSESSSSSWSTRLFRIICDRKSIRVRDLWSISDLDVIDFSKSLDALKQADLISLVGEGADEQIRLSKLGEQLAEVAR